MEFKPKKKQEKEVISLHLSLALSREIKKAIEVTGLKKQEMIRQMIEHCLENLDFKTHKKEKHHREEF